MPTTSSPDPLSGELDELRRARAYLARVAEPPAPALAAFIDAHGPVDAAHRVRAQDVPEPVRRETAARHGLNLAAADLTHTPGARLVIPEDDEWPTSLITALGRAATTGAAWATPPIALWVQSATPLCDALTNAVSIVGARAATGYGEHVAADFAYRLTQDGMTVVSGAAYGIDSAAHRGALAVHGGVTVAVVATGINLTYPAGNQRLLDEIRDRGVVVREYPPDTPPARHRFLTRNRLVAALSRGTVVVEAGIRSGTLNTARRARALGRPVMAVPGPITSATSAGSHQLLRDHTAVLVTSHADIHHTLDATRPRTT
jgi:DNA processing protein